MPTMNEIQQASRKKRERQCIICEAGFLVRDASRSTRTCSAPCRATLMRSDEVKAKRSASLKKFREANPEAENKRKLAASVGFKNWLDNPDNAAEFSRRSRASMISKRQDPEFMRRSRLAHSRAMGKVSAEVNARRRRNCPVCGSNFIAKRSDSVGLCSRKCQDAHFSAITTGTVQSAETKTKRIASISSFRQANPERESARKESVRKATQSAEYVASARARYKLMAKNKTGICSEWSRSVTAEIGKWVLTKAKEALVAETTFIDLWNSVQSRIRREIPYDGPSGTSDYYNYLKKIGKAITADPEIRAMHDNFMREAIPRFHSEWKRTAALRAGRQG